MEPLLRRYYATHGKHVGDGMLYYFLPQPDSNYVMNAVRCGVEMREKMREIDDRWTRKKNWVNRLRVNIGIDEGQEWFGTYQTPTHLEFTALGDTINNASRLSDFATDGTIWVTKNVLGRLTSEERDRLTFGVRRQGADGEEILVSSTFARIGNLVEARQINDIKYRDVAALPVTEVLDYRERK
jgi:class 3 adenylate cyclase